MRTDARVVFCAGALLALAACDRMSTTQADQNGATVGQKIDTALEKTRQNLAVAGRKTEEKLQEAGAKISAATDDARNDVKSSDAGARLNDTAITASIKTDYLKDPDLSVLKIDVDTKDGVVTLNGLAADDAARARAEKLAGSIKGVKEVRNFLTVKRA